ncbi:hypothetical protein GCM10011381_05880 [Klenkia taihuensis]|nr:hypothetical protein GCM10011381_05880 [Klenkia taihuensis]
MSAHCASGSGDPVEAAIDGISGAPRLLMTATTVPTKSSTGTRPRGGAGADTGPGSQVVARVKLSGSGARGR